MKKINLFIFLFTLCFMISSVSAFAKITVTSVKGQAKYKTGRSWVALKSGITLQKGTKISTGIRSEVILNINNNTVTIKQMSMMKIEDNLLNSSESKTAIGLKRGGIRARISRIQKLKTDFKITTPVATSSVRGTEEDVSYGPGSGMIVKVIEGEILARNNLGSSNLIKGKLEYRQDNDSSTPRDVNASRQEASRGTVTNKLTQEEKEYLEDMSDINEVTDQIGDIEQTIFETPSYYDYGSGNIHVVPVFP
ncbi:MAG: FecR domain-containing protein [Spirochaetes bacterium]|nr:FecR domain-containing protein [Spirochaetota bacterium]